MKQEALYTDKQPSVIYTILNPVKADVIVNKYIGEEEMLQENMGTQTFYKYEMNSFSVNPNDITKEMVESHVDYYLEYEHILNESVEQKIERLENENRLLTECIVELSEVIFNG